MAWAPRQLGFSATTLWATLASCFSRTTCPFASAAEKPMTTAIAAADQAATVSGRRWPSSRGRNRIGSSMNVVDSHARSTVAAMIATLSTVPSDRWVT